MIDVELKAGDIFTWKNYPYYTDKFKPQRWLLYLGNNSIEAVFYQITTTTQYQHYTQDGYRKSNNFFELQTGIGGLEEKSILDLSFFVSMPEAYLNNHKSDITRRGTLPQEYINKFVKHLKIDRHIQTIVKKDIYRYLRDAGFTVS